MFFVVNLENGAIRLGIHNVLVAIGRVNMTHGPAPGCVTRSKTKQKTEREISIIRIAPKKQYTYPVVIITWVNLAFVLNI